MQGVGTKTRCRLTGTSARTHTHNETPPHTCSWLSGGASPLLPPPSKIGTLTRYAKFNIVEK